MNVIQPIRGQESLYKLYKKLLFHVIILITLYNYCVRRIIYISYYCFPAGQDVVRASLLSCFLASLMVFLTAFLIGYGGN